MKNIHQKVKKLDVWDVRLIKLSTIAFVLLILNLWKEAIAWVSETHWGWFLAATIIFMLRPMKKYFGKR